MSILHIKNMFCKRCVMTVDNLLKQEGYHVNHIELGEADVAENPGSEKLERLNKHY